MIALGKDLWANTNFDIENWILGFRWALSKPGEIPLEGKKTFARIFNKMLTGSTEYPVGFNDSWSRVFYQTEADAKAKRVDTLFNMQVFENQRLGGGDRFVKMVRNLGGEPL